MDLPKRSSSHVTPTQTQFIASRKQRNRGCEGNSVNETGEAERPHRDNFSTSKICNTYELKIGFIIHLTVLKRLWMLSSVRVMVVWGYMCFIHMEARETHVRKCSQFTGSAVLCDQHLLACRCPRLKYRLCVCVCVCVCLYVCVTYLRSIYTHAVHKQYNI